MSTFIVACRGSDGVAVVADRRVVDRQRMELISDTERKAFVVGEKLVAAFDGANVAWVDILTDLQRAMERGAIEAFQDAVGVVRESFRSAWDRYAPLYPEEMQFNGFFAGLGDLTSGVAELAVVGPGGLADRVTQFQCGGSAGLKSQNLVRLLWDRKMPVDDLWKLGVFCCCYTATFDLTVGGVPTVHLVKDERGVEEVQPGEVAGVMAATDGVASRLPRQVLGMLSDPD